MQNLGVFLTPRAALYALKTKLVSKVASFTLGLVAHTQTHWARKFKKSPGQKTR